MTSIDAKVIARFREYKLTDILARHCGDSFPWELAAAMVEIECSGDVHAYNFYQDGHLKRGSWNPDEPPPDGEHGRPLAWAAGPFQIIRKYDRGLSLRERFDPEKSADVIFPEWKLFFLRAKMSGLTEFDRNAATYFAQNQGAGRQAKGLKHAAGGIEAVVYNSGLDEDVAPNALAVCRKVAAHASMWKSIKTEMFADLVCQPGAA